MVSFKLRLIREQNRLYTYLLRLLSIFQPNGSKIFIFHDIMDDISLVKTKFAISQTSFEKFILFQLSKGYHINTLDEQKEIILGKKKRQDNSFSITFDDANESVYTKAYPFLKLYNIPFVIFITQELIGKPNYLNKEQITTLAADPLCTVGSHAYHHVMFRYLTSKETEMELRESKLFLEGLIGKSIDCFAFPYGRLVECSIQNIKDLKLSDYDFAFSAIAGTLNQSWISSDYFLPRINVDENLVKRDIITTNL